MLRYQMPSDAEHRYNGRGRSGSFVFGWYAITSYIEKGLLADISDIPAEAGGQDGLFEKVANAFKRRENLWNPLRLPDPIVPGG